ncbi:Short-chain dehydrogenase/reductase [Quillaja saponaria]|uniref:Short-chain dehydrogenase/reductase n=1 Tax=Quillaja saponaria TaxID=32244 RepID=A0AAD7L7L5_QUISA|nr:Short-chain dehydrogenase/reductase [Quillaja saponaria]
MSGRKVVLVTGCAKGGIGYEYCRAFAKKNCQVFATDIPPRMRDMSDLPSHNIETLELDVLSDESVASAVDTIMSKCGHIDVLINNAGIGITGPLAEIPLDAFKKNWEINTLGSLRLIHQVVPYMVLRRSGTIVNIGSVVGRVPTPWAGSYCASKAAVHAMSHVLRLELKPFGINVVLVQPAAIRSNFGSASLEKLANQDWKLYKEFKEVIADRARASQSGKSTDAGVFARHVAEKVLSSSPPPKEIIFGHMTLLFAFLSWCPLWVRDLFFSFRFGLNKRV